MTGARSSVSLDELEAALGAFRRRPGTLFDVYAFADYRGDLADAGGVVLAVALGADGVRLVEGVRNRRTLSAALLRLLRVARSADVRLLFGQDHQYGIPMPLAKELGLRGAWRSMMRELFVTGPLAREAMAGNAGRFAATANAWLVARGCPAYFFSHTNGARYGIPTARPRPKGDPTERRLTERSTGFPLCRVGDNGSVGGQSIVGIPRLLTLLDDCEREGVPVKVWPFDGLALDTLGATVAIEPYPSALRAKGILKSDENDAIGCATWAQRHDHDGTLLAELDLSGLGPAGQRRVRVEGWMAGARP